MKQRTLFIRSFRQRVRAIAPNALFGKVHRLFGRNQKRGDNFWTGDFESWDTALSRCKGYGEDSIFQKVREALLAVKAGQAAFERDSVLFDKAEYAWPLVALLSRVAGCDNNRLSVLDFGGSLGSTYFQNRRWFGWLDELKWSVVEQGHFVVCGREEFAGNGLEFYESVEECLAVVSPNVVLLSGVLPYLEDPYEILEEIMERRIPHMIIDRTPILLAGGRDRLAVQTVPPTIYEASYPTWFFNREKLLDFLRAEYALVAEFEALDGEATLENPRAFAKYFGWFLKCRDRA